MFPDAPDELGRVPFMHRHQIDTVQRFLEVEIQSVAIASELWIRRVKAFDRRIAIVRPEVLNTPSVFRLKDGDGMPALDQFSRDPAEEMRVPVIPVRDE